MSAATAEVTLQRILLATVRANGVPKGQPRPRAFSRGGRAAVYDPGTAEGWKGCVAVACKDCQGLGWHQALAVRLTFYLPRPKSHYNSKGSLRPAAPHYIHTNTPDVDNLAKAVLDAMTNIHVWLDDDQVCELVVRKFWELPGYEQPGCHIQVFEMREVKA